MPVGAIIKRELTMENRKGMIAGLFLVVVITAALVIWLLIRPEKLGNISHSFSTAEPATNISTITFVADEGDKIKFVFSSNIEQGELDIVVYDSAGNPVKQLDRARELVTYLTPDRTDTYTLSAEYTDFVGKFNIRVYKAD